MCDYESYEVSSKNTRHARKEYQCSEGGHVIAKGEKHIVIKGLFDGTWEQSRTCIKCANGRHTLYEAGRHGCPVPIGGLRDAITEEISEYWPPGEILPEWLQGFLTDYGLADPRRSAP